ncbi:MAG: DNA methyltransferase [Dokdonella sp.]
MTPHEFMSKWKGGGDERRDAQPFFEDICRLLKHQTPREADPEHEWFTYEYGATKASGGEGWADVWKKGYFGWEAKGTHKNLDKAYQQLKMYADALENPPLLVVSDLHTIIIHTNFTNSVKTEYKFTIEDLANHKTLDILRAVFFNPEQLRPGKTRQTITEDAARQFATLAERLRARKHPPLDVAHFLNRLLFCMFAEDVGLLPDDLFTKMVRASKGNPGLFDKRAKELFAAMQKGGDVAFQNIPWFNGGLFDNDSTLPLQADEIDILQAACDLEWDEIDPSIFGTLFERGLDPKKRSQLGAHYTDPDTIMRIVGPVIVEPWKQAWEVQKAEISALMEKADLFGPTAKTPAEKAARTKAGNDAKRLLGGFLDSLKNFIVLDPACGSGNFLFLALRALKDIEHSIHVDVEAMGMGRMFPSIGPENVRGIELNEYAAELARITIWIGEIQWMIQKGYGANQNPILRPLNQIENRDALVNTDFTEAKWPVADVVIGNPPFVGDKKMKGELGVEYTDGLRATYKGRVPGGADLVCYWFQRSYEAIVAGRLRNAGLVATNSIRGGRNRVVLDHIVDGSTIFDAWSDEPWVNEGARVRVSIVCFGARETQTKLNGAPVNQVNADLTALTDEGGIDTTGAKKQKENLNCCFLGIQKTGEFEVDGATARKWLVEPNASGQPNRDVVRPWFNGIDIMRRPRDYWIVDYGTDTTQTEAARYALPYAHVDERVRPKRVGKREERTNTQWWIFQWARPLLRRAIKNKTRFIATPEIAQQRVFVWVDARITPDKNLTIVARDDDTTFGILHSKLHEVWALRVGTSLEDRPRYTPTTCFETFPFPDGLTPNIAAADYAGDPRTQRIAEAAQALVRDRDNWLNPPDWTNRVPEVVDDLPDRIQAKPGKEEALKRRTLNNLYAENPQWLKDLHLALDQAVAAAYGWEWPLSEDEILTRLLALNKSRVGVG